MIDLGARLTGEKLSFGAVICTAEDIERLAASAVETKWIDAMFDRIEAVADEAAYPFSVSDDLAFVDAEIERLERLIARVDPDLIDNYADEAVLAALYEHRAELKEAAR
jgi:hypothetical protein